MGAELESIRWTFQGKMNSWTFQGQLCLALKQTLRRGREKKERKWDKRRNCASSTLCRMCFLFSSLASVTVIVIRCLTLLKKKKKPEKEKGGGRKRIQQCFFPACWKWAQSCQEEVCWPFPGAEEWRGSDATWGRYGGERERGAGPWLPASHGLFSLDGSVDLWSSHTDGDRLVCLSHLQPHRPLALINSVQNTRLHTARLVLPTCGLLLEQWFITNHHWRYREMQRNSRNLDSSCDETWKYDEIEEKNASRQNKSEN